MPRELDTSYTEEIICPYCGAENQDYDEIHYSMTCEDEEEVGCSNCGKEYRISVVDFKYWFKTEKLKDKENETSK